MAAGEYEPGGLLQYRVKKLEERVEEFEDKLDEVKATLNRLLLTIAAGSVGIAFSVLIGSGKI